MIQKKIEEMGIQGRKFVEENFSWKVITQKFVKDLKKISDKKKIKNLYLTGYTYSTFNFFKICNF